MQSSILYHKVANQMLLGHLTSRGGRQQLSPTVVPPSIRRRTNFERGGAIPPSWLLSTIREMILSLFKTIYTTSCGREFRKLIVHHVHEPLSFPLF